MSHLLGMSSADMCKAFTRPRIKVGTEMVTKGQNVAQCTGATGAIAKATFDKLFQWLVKMCNRTLDTDLPRSYFCGVLDIAGFEIFDVSILLIILHIADVGFTLSLCVGFYFMTFAVCRI